MYIKQVKTLMKESGTVEITEVTGEKPKKLKFYESWTFIIIVCVILPLTFRSLVYSPYNIPSGSMKSTLLIGDYIIASKSAYGYSRYSFPFGGIFNYFNGRTGWKEPRRGEVIIFRPPKEPSTDFIKRLIGLPGDTIQVIDGELYINNEKVPRRQISDFVEEQSDGSVVRIKRYIESLPGGVNHIVLDETPNGKYDNTQPIAVPEGYYLFMGDNRDNSEDSRGKHVGLVPAENIVARAEYILASNKAGFKRFWMWPFSFRSDRFWLTMEEAQNPGNQQND